MNEFEDKCICFHEIRSFMDQNFFDIELHYKSMKKCIFKPNTNLLKSTKRYTSKVNRYILPSIYWNLFS